MKRRKAVATPKALETTQKVVEFLAGVRPSEEPGLAALGEVVELLVLAQDEGNQLREKVIHFLEMLLTTAAHHKKPPSVDELRPDFGDTAELACRLLPAARTLLESLRAYRGSSSLDLDQDRIWIEGALVAALTKPGSKGTNLLTSLTKDFLGGTAKRFGVDPDELANATVEKMMARKGPVRTYKPGSGVRKALRYVRTAVQSKANDVLPHLPRTGVPSPRKRQEDDGDQRWQEESLADPQPAEDEPAVAQVDAVGPNLMELPPGTRRRWKMQYRKWSSAPVAPGDQQIFDHLAALFDPSKRLELDERGERYHVGKLQESLEDRKAHANHEAKRMSLMQISRLPAVRDRFGTGDNDPPPKKKVWSSFRRLKKAGKVKGVQGAKGTWMVDETEIRAILADVGLGVSDPDAELD
jgi:hypothetical protein